MDKKYVISLVIKKLEEAKESDEKSLAATRQAVINAPGAMQSHSDTTRFQMGQLAESVEKAITDKVYAMHVLGQFMIEDKITSDLVKLGTLVDLEDEKAGIESYFILPVAGGVKVTANHRQVTVITARSPLGVLLIGKSKGEIVELRLGPVAKKLRIISLI